MNAIMMEKFGQKHPEIKSILDRVDEADIEQKDKEMIYDQLIYMACLLKSAKYKILTGRWRGENTYSARREKVAEPIVSETIFTIAADDNMEVLYVDLPIAV